MFQPWFKELVSVLSEIIVGISAVVAIIAGIFGFKKWRTELRGKVGLELALKIALLAREFRDKFNWVTNGFTLRSEFAERQKGYHETPGEAQVNDEYFARANRLRSLRETMRNLQVARWEAELILDEGIGKFFEPIEDVFTELSEAINKYFRMERERLKSNGKALEWDNEEYVSLYKTVYGMTNSEIGESVDAAVNALLEELKRYIKW